MSSEFIRVSTILSQLCDVLGFVNIVRKKTAQMDFVLRVAVHLFNVFGVIHSLH